MRSAAIALALFCATAAPPSSTLLEASCASSSVRVRIAPAGAPADAEPVVQARRDGCASGASDPTALTSGNVRVAFTPLLTVTRVADGALLLQEVDGSRTQAPRAGEVDARGQQLFSSAIAFSFASGTRVYGLGEHKTGRVDYAADGGFFWRFEDSQNRATLADNGDISLPVMHLSTGVTIVLNVPSYGSINVTSASVALTVNSSVVLDLWVSVADAGEPTFASLMGHLAQLVGPPAPLPDWASGFIQCKLRYRDQAELLAAAQGYVDRGYPISAIVIDYMSWPAFGTWQWIERCWPDPAGMVEQLDTWGIALIQSVWPNIESGSFRFPEMLQRGFLTTNASGVAYPFNTFDKPTYIYDPFSPEARAYLSSALYDGYGKAGVAAYWLDADEPQGARPGLEYYSLGRDVELGLAYPRFHQQGIFEGQIARGAASAMSLSRGAWLGSAQYGGAVWSGDVQSNWTSFQQQIAIAQNMQLSGMFLWTTDIGGFVNGDMDDPSFLDLIVRWFQFGAFCPLFRVHGVRSPGLPDTACGSAGAHTEVWAYGARNEPILAGLLFLRDRMREYIADRHRLAEQTGVPILTPMFFHFPDDAECWAPGSETQFVFGGDWLVAPVSELNATSRSVFFPTLPSGEHWVPFYDGLVPSPQVDGGQRLDVSFTIATFPLFRRSSLNLTKWGI